MADPIVNNVDSARVKKDSVALLTGLQGAELGSLASFIWPLRGAYQKLFSSKAVGKAGRPVILRNSMLLSAATALLGAAAGYAYGTALESTAVSENVKFPPKARDSLLYYPGQLSSRSRDDMIIGASVFGLFVPALTRRTSIAVSVLGGATWGAGLGSIFSHLPESVKKDLGI